MRNFNAWVQQNYRTRIVGKLFTLSFVFSLLAACSYDDMLEKTAPKEEIATAKAALENVRVKNFAEIKKRLSPELLTSDVDQKLGDVSNSFPSGEPTSIKLVGSNVFTSSGYWQANLTYQYQFPQGWAVANILLVRDGNQESRIRGFTVDRSPASLEEINAFTFQHKSITHYTFLFLAASSILLILYALALCIRTPITKRKWLWILIVLIGIGGFSINWTTGEILTQFVSIRLFGIGAGRANLYSPWFFTFSIPIGALVFLVRRKALMKPAIELPTLS